MFILSLTAPQEEYKIIALAVSMSRYVQSGAQHLLILVCGTKSAAKLSTDKILLIYKNEKENKKGGPLKKFVFFTLFYVKFYIYYRLRQSQYTGGALLFDFIIW